MFRSFVSGWHICGTCQKGSSYMCYTCTFSVCKRCIKDADYVIVRGNMGLCGTCIKPIMLIENISQGDNEAVRHFSLNLYYSFHSMLSRKICLGQLYFTVRGILFVDFSRFRSLHLYGVSIYLDPMKIS